MTDKTEELKPAPCRHCESLSAKRGGTARPTPPDVETKNTYYVVICTWCRSHGPSCSSVEDAIISWNNMNTSQVEDALRAELKEAKAIIADQGIIEKITRSSHEVQRLEEMNQAQYEHIIMLKKQLGMTDD